MVYALALSLVRASDADDVVQDAFLRAFRNLDLLADPARFGVWLRRITFGVAIDHVRADKARQPGLGASPDLEEEIEAEDPGLSPLEQLERREVVDRVLAALDRLPARYRVPLTLYHIDGLTHAKVARTLDVPEATVRSLVARARQKLARLLANAPEVRDMTEASPLPRSGDVLDEPASSPRFLHVLNGDSVRMTLEQSQVPGTFAVYAEVLHEGPVPREIGTRAWRETRARFISSAGYGSYADAKSIGEEWERRLEAYADYDEVVLWFEHDLFDQLLLIRHLDWFSRRDAGTTTLSLICIGEFPGFEPFHGLGQLDADQLTSLLGTRQPVVAGQLALGRRAWAAFTADDPRDLDRLVREGDTRALPFLAGALQRLLDDYPAVENGLPRTERQILELLADGPKAPARLFVAVQKREERVFMGDTTFWARVLGLSRGPVPLVTVREDGPGEYALPRGSVEITEAGREVLAGRSDWISLDGYDRWLGGVHLTAALGGDVRWRVNGGTINQI
jgi:RNA polymerase sigma factor (sigma-70 family)